MEDRKWMYLDNQTYKEYLSGVKLFIPAAEADMLSQNKSPMFCPCHDCKNIKEYKNSMTLRSRSLSWRGTWRASPMQATAVALERWRMAQSDGRRQACAADWQRGAMNMPFFFSFFFQISKKKIPFYYLP